MRRLADRLFAPIDIASLVYYRIFFSLLMVVEAVRYTAGGMAHSYFMEPGYHFTYLGFGWVTPWAAGGMLIHWGVLGVAALCMMFGYFYRIAATVFFLGFTYSFLLDKARYLNHFYLVLLIAFVMIFLPANRAVALDARRRPETRLRTVPAWTLWILRAQMGCVYFFGGVAKINSDWLQAEPLKSWLGERIGLPVVGPLIGTEYAAYLMSYGGLFFDLMVTPLLLWRRTRLFALAYAIVFHFSNTVLFNIGIFPWLALGTTLLFLEPSWPRRLLRRLQRRPIEPDVESGFLPAASPSTRQRRWVLGFLAIYMGLQIFIPLRHHLYPGNVLWTEEGHRFSWRMKLRGKDGWARFTVRDPESGETWTINPEDRLTPRQARKMACVPDMVIQYAHDLADEFRERGHPRVTVHARVKTSLNRRAPQLLVDPDIDLAAQPIDLWPAPWILPLTTPLHDR